MARSRSRLLLRIITEAELSALTPDQAEMVSANTGLAHSLANKFAARWNVDIEDADQEALFALSRAAAKFDPTFGTKFSTYAWTAIQNSLQGMVKPIKGERLGRVDLDSAAFDDEGGEHSAYDVVGSVDPDMEKRGQSDMIDRAQQAIANLPEKERAILSGWMAGKDYRTLGTELGISHTYVMKILKRSLETLRGQLKF